MKCEPDAEGCASWRTIEVCSGGLHCDETQKKCVDACASRCTSGQLCDNGTCVCNPALPEGWPETLIPLKYPLLVPTNTAVTQDEDNIYAPEIHEVLGLRVMWYGV